MLKFIDTHSHLYSSRFRNDMSEVVERAKEVLSHIILPNIDLGTIEVMNALADQSPDFFFPTMGLHPCYVDEHGDQVLDMMEKEFGKRKYWAIGEAGLDYYWDKTKIPAQKAALRRQIEWAKSTDLPLILHCRESMDDVIDLVEEGQDGRLKGIFHCFTGDANQAARIQDLGFLMGIGGVVTYKSSDLPQTLANVPLTKLVLETDSPYLPPVPHRGKRNESSYVPIIARKLSEIKGVSLREIAEVTSQNAQDLFFPGRESA